MVTKNCKNNPNIPSTKTYRSSHSTSSFVPQRAPKSRQNFKRAEKRCFWRRVRRKILDSNLTNLASMMWSQESANVRLFYRILVSIPRAAHFSDEENFLFFVTLCNLSMSHTSYITSHTYFTCCTEVGPLSAVLSSTTLAFAFHQP